MCKQCACKQRATKMVSHNKKTHINSTGGSSPNREELKRLIRNTPFTVIGKQYGVSSAAVVKWCKNMKLPWRKTDIDTFTDKEWNSLECFTPDMKKERVLYDYDAVIEMLEKFHSVKYTSKKLNMTTDAIYDICKARKFHVTSIEWSPTTCHIIGTDLYFRTTTDAGHWLAEQGTELQHVVQDARGKRVKSYIDKQEPLYGYQFEYVKEEEYFDIIEKYEVISYTRQSKRLIPKQIKRLS